MKTEVWSEILDDLETHSYTLADCAARLRISARLAPFTFCTLTAFVFAASGANYGVYWAVASFSLGVIIGFFVSQMVVAIFEWLALHAIYLDRISKEHEDSQS